MKSKNRYDGIHPYVIFIVRYQAHNLCRSKYFNVNDLEDLEQELMLSIYEHLPEYSPQISSFSTFINKVVKQKTFDLLRKEMAQKKGNQFQFISLDQPVVEKQDNHVTADTIVLGTTLLETTEHNLYCDADINDQDLCYDFVRAVSSLPESLSDLCILLSDNNITEISQSLGISRSKVYRSMTKLRSALKDVGLDKYL